MLIPLHQVPKRLSRSRDSEAPAPDVEFEPLAFELSMVGALPPENRSGISSLTFAFFAPRVGLNWARNIGANTFNGRVSSLSA